MRDRLDGYLTQWVRELAVGHTLTEADRKVLDRVVLALQSPADQTPTSTTPKREPRRPSCRRLHEQLWMCGT